MTIKRNKIENFLHFPADVIVFEQTDSTNNEAKRRAPADHAGVKLYVTDCQTAGRGRRGHDFYSPKGSGLYFTLALPLAGDPADTQFVTCAAGVAVCEAIEALADRQARIKWVNDVLIDGKKVAGVLTELVTDDDNQPISVIVGIGVNLTTAHFPAEFAACAGSVGDVDPNRLCATVANRLCDMYMAATRSEKASNDSYNSILEKYSALNLCLGRKLRYTDSEGAHIAAAVAIAHDGSLIVEENGVRKALHSGEISIIPI